MDNKVLKTRRVLLLFFSCSLFISVGGVPQVELLTAMQEQGHFCYVVKSADSSPPGAPTTIPMDELILWNSQPGLSLFMLVNVTVGAVYEAATGTVKVGAQHLSEGEHDLSYSLAVGEEDQLYISVMVDGEMVPPENSTSAYHLQDSSFTSVTVTGKGPIIYRWNHTCAEPTIPPEEAKTRLPDSSGHSAPAAEPSQDDSSEASQSKAVSVVLWIFIGIGSAGLLLLAIVGVALFIQRSSKSRHDHLVRMAEAERQKQTITNAAQRLSYIEQIKWTADDRGGENAVRLMST